MTFNETQQLRLFKLLKAQMFKWNTLDHDGLNASTLQIDRTSEKNKSARGIFPNELVESIFHWRGLYFGIINEDSY